MGWRGKIWVMAVPSMIRWVRLAAAAKTLRLSPPEALPLVIQAAVKPRFSRSSMADRAVLLSAAVTATPILFSVILSSLGDSPIHGPSGTLGL